MTATPSMQIRRLEELALNAWPALQTLHLDGWVLRFANGYTRRANSVSPLYPPSGLLDEAVTQAEAHFARRGLPAVFKMTTAAEPAGLDEALAARGYAADAHTSVQVVELAGANLAAPGVTKLAEAVNDDWLSAIYGLAQISERHRPTLRQMLGLLAPAAACATLSVDGTVVACGLAVAEAGHVGLFDIVTHPDHRRQGHARRLILDLLAWGQAQGAHTGYLQVMLNNPPALALYAGLGYREVYRYWYRVRP